MKWVLLLGSLMGCSDARYSGTDAGDAYVLPNEAGVRREEPDARDSQPRQDAQMQRDPAAALLGKYAVHARFYGREQTTGLADLAHELILIADITREAGGLEMRVQTCQDSGYLLTAGLRTDVRVKDPAKFPVRTFGLVVEGKSFYSTGEALTIGYTKQAPSACTSGGRAASTDKWTNGSCECVGGVDAPTRADDCRVIDSDQDQAPGMTIVASGFVNATQSVRITDRSQYVFGVIDEASKRHRANYQKDEDLRELGCSAGDCMSYQARLCAISTQLVTFVPLAEPDISCSDVLQRVGTNELFPGEGLDGSFPTGC